MTIADLIAAGHADVRKPYWHPGAYLRLHLVAGGHGPWGDLYDAPGHAALGKLDPQRILLTGDLVAGDGWEPYRL